MTREYNQLRCLGFFCGVLFLFGGFRFVVGFLFCFVFCIVGDELICRLVFFHSRRNQQERVREVVEANVARTWINALTRKSER